MPSAFVTNYGANAYCDGGVLSHATGEVRVLPLGRTVGGSNLILCRLCFDREIDWRRKRNWDLAVSARFDLPTWNSLEIYAP